MYEEFTREMNDAERSELEAMVNRTKPIITARDSWKWFAIWAGGLLACIALCALGAVFLNDKAMTWVIVVSFFLGGPLAIAALICLYAVIQVPGSYFHWKKIHKRFRRETVPKIIQDLQDGNVYVRRIRADAAIEIVEFEDEGGGYIFDIGVGKSFLLKGQRYFPDDEKAEWPNSDFEIVRSTSGQWIGICCHGIKLEPKRTIETGECKEDFVFDEREEILERDIDSVAKSLLKDSEAEITK